MGGPGDGPKSLGGLPDLTRLIVPHRDQEIRVTQAPHAGTPPHFAEVYRLVSVGFIELWPALINTDAVTGLSSICAAGGDLSGDTVGDGIKNVDSL